MTTKTIRQQQVETMLTHYKICARWVGVVNKEGTNLVDIDDCEWSEEAEEQMREDIEDFIDSNIDDIYAWEGPTWTAFEQAGHDFFLTRNSHGAGFWDGEWPDDVGQRLTAASEPYGSQDIYVGDNGLLYVL